MHGVLTPDLMSMWCDLTNRSITEASRKSMLAIQPFGISINKDPYDLDWMRVMMPILKLSSWRGRMHGLVKAEAYLFGNPCAHLISLIEQSHQHIVNNRRVN